MPAYIYVADMTVIPGRKDQGMRRVAEIIHIVESEREKFLHDVINLDEESQKVLWMCGVRKQQYFTLNELIFMTFEYEGTDFYSDMDKMGNYLSAKGILVEKRRKDVPVNEREVTNWWAPVKKVGSVLDSKPDFAIDEWNMDRQDLLSGYTGSSADYNDISYSDDDWVDDIRI